MGANPFNKQQFNAYRDWEQSLVEFFVREAKKPNMVNWLSMVNGADSPRSVAYSALLLSNLVSSKPNYTESAKALYSVYERLTEQRGNASEFEEWLHSDWLNVSRVANMFKAELMHH
ncbi:hypothetical protein GALL_117820 [mine drainage metagenome]|uniref:Uncharacterized protein n=1 Tax=mine drainage metagenome TaxID=410659 RepID=A0A1J5SBT9_9ZZZZ